MPDRQSLLHLRTSARVQCQVCGRMLVPLKDGTSRRHLPRRYASHVEPVDRSLCRGSGHQLARWDVGQILQHHSGDFWQVAEDRGGRWGDYLMQCFHGRENGREMVAHGEYMHRHGWTPTVALAVTA